MYDVTIEKNSVSLVFTGLSQDFVDELLGSLVSDGTEVNFHISYSEDVESEDVKND